MNSDKPPYSQSLELQNAIARVKELEQQLSEANVTLDTITTDVDYEGGVQYWLKKNSQLMRDNLSILQQLTASRELNQKMYEALESFLGDVEIEKEIAAARQVLALAREQGLGKQ